MAGVIAIRNETKSRWERRSPLPPSLVRHLVSAQGMRVLVQPSSHRVFHDKDYVRAGAELTLDLSDSPVVFGVKEIPADLLTTDTTYVFFSHVIKGQTHNMEMLQRLIDLKCTLIDYEMIRAEDGRRLIFFGRFAGLAGMIDTLWSLGRRFASLGIDTALADMKPAHAFDDLAGAEDHIAQIGRRIARDGLPESIVPLTIGIAGYGNVANGAHEILANLPTETVSPDRIHKLATSGQVSNRVLYTTTFKEQDLVEPIDPGKPFDLQHYYENPGEYQSRFEPALEHLTAVVNANYWDPRYPRLITCDGLRRIYGASGQPKLQVIGDLGCDIGGNVECTVTCTLPDDPVFVWDPDTGEINYGFDGRGPVVLAVDILPTELPREASEEFASALAPFARAIGRADYSVSFDDLDLPPAVKRGVIVHGGRLTPEFEYLEGHLKTARPDSGQ